MTRPLIASILVCLAVALLLVPLLADGSVRLTEQRASVPADDRSAAGSPVRESGVAGTATTQFERDETGPTGTRSPVPTPSPAITPTPVIKAQLVWSPSADRSNPQPLAGATLQGLVYAFVTTEDELTEVVYTVDGSVVQTEQSAPWDMQGGVTSNARPWNTTTVANGEYTITVTLRARDGQTETLAAVVTVENRTALRVVNVATATELKRALEQAMPGDEIRLADGTYDSNVTIAVSGTAEHPIVLRGSRDAVLHGAGEEEYGIHITDADYWIMEGFTITGFHKGIETRDMDFSVIRGVEIHTIEQEAIHLREHSSNNRIEGVYIHDTGTVSPQWGEGIYIGSDSDHWDTYSGGEPDGSSDNVIEASTIGPNVTAEYIEFKEGTEDNHARHNTLDGTGQPEQAAAESRIKNSLIHVKGNANLVEDNILTQPGYHGVTLYADDVPGWGRENVVRSNTIDMAGKPGVGIYDESYNTTNEYCENTVTNGRFSNTEACD